VQRLDKGKVDDLFFVKNDLLDKEDYKSDLFVTPQPSDYMGPTSKNQ